VTVEECEGFRNALMELGGSGEDEVVVDVSGVEYVGSSWIGPLAAAMARARTKGVKVKIIAEQRAALLLAVAGLGMLGEVRAVEE
jgi:anti-anti-sigma regulatory factor